MRALRASWNLNGWSDTGLAFGIHPPKTANGFGRAHWSGPHWVGLAEDASSAVFSASCYDFSEDVLVLAVVVPERKLGQVERGQV